MPAVELSVQDLFITKSQRLLDLKVANPSLSEDELKKRLDELLAKGLIEVDHRQDDDYYFKKDL